MMNRAGDDRGSTEPSTTHSNRHEEKLEAIVVGQLAENSTEAQQLLASCVECRESFEAMKRVIARLDDAAQLERDALAEDGTTPGESLPGDEQIASTLRRLATGQLVATSSHDGREEGELAERSSPGSWMWPAVAAAVMIVCLSLWGPDSGTEVNPRSGDVSLSSTSVESLTPQGRVVAWGTFRWKHALEAGAGFEVTIEQLDAAGNVTSETTFVTEEQQWTPDPEVSASWSQKIYWQVRVVTVSGDSIAQSKRVAVELGTTP